MSSAAAVRRQLESALAARIPSAFTPVARTVRPVVSSGIESLDRLLRGGIPIGALSEITGPESSGRTSLAHSFIASILETGKVAAWIDVSDALDPISAAEAGIELSRLLWVRCGVITPPTPPPLPPFVLPKSCLEPPVPKKGLHGGGHGTHPRSETRGLPAAVNHLLQPQSFAPRCAEPQRRAATPHLDSKPVAKPLTAPHRKTSAIGPYQRIEQGLKSADLLLQSGGFGAIVLDLGSMAPDFVSRIELATWHRYRVAAERTQSSILLLTQHVCAKSSAELLLRLHPAQNLRTEPTLFYAALRTAEIVRHRFPTTQTSNVLSIRKPPQKANTPESQASWTSQTFWSGHPA